MMMMIGSNQCQQMMSSSIDGGDEVAYYDHDHDYNVNIIQCATTHHYYYYQL